ncbi:MAG: hypothetical protein AB7F89_26330 [Pirellulaceae bacterium]
MMTDPNGEPVLSAGSYRPDHATPLNKRWGGWFVTGTHGEAQHLGNVWLPDNKRPRKPIDNSTGSNLTDLSPRTDLSMYLTPHSDIVALLVFEHQIDAHNYAVRTRYAWTLANHHGSGSDLWRDECDELVEHLLYTGETRLPDPISGTSRFAEEFAARGPVDGGNRSLRQFDLKSRMFRFPVSYMVYSDAFQGLPEEVKAYAYERLAHSLQELSNPLGSFSRDERESSLQIFRATIPGAARALREAVRATPDR